ncbi:unnamed protein product [Somion occarium]|uniref:Rho GTPase activation protein n=1 Tax=Somion occarium TaxID=3059160 RepID=A0ABP1CNZ4_9APHY
MDSHAGPSGSQEGHQARSSNRSKQPKEIFVSVETYVSSKTAKVTAKNHLSRSKTDRRERPNLAPHDHSKKVKEKSSWISLPKSNTQVDQWRPATCKLVEEESGCTLKIYIDQTYLYMTIRIHLLYYTDIRRIHHSVYSNKNCLGIFCDSSSDRAWCPTGNVDSACLKFEDSDALNLWMGLLRSYTAPEIYGRRFSTRDGGLYRMWRQVYVQCQHGRNLGSTRSIQDDGQPSDYDSNVQVIDMDVYCELYFNGHLSGRTTTQKGIGSPDWREDFLFEDLPPFDQFEIRLFRDRRLAKPTKIGTVPLPLPNFRRGEWVEGDLKLRIRVEEEIILPSSAYTQMWNVFQSRNLLEWIDEFKSRWKLEHIQEPIQQIAMAKDMLLNTIMEMVDREVENAQGESHVTIFRAASPLTKAIQAFMKFRGQEFLEASVGANIRRFRAEKVIIDVDAVRSDKHTKTVERNVSTFVQWCEIFWKSIYDARTQCPSDMRKLFAYIRKQIEQRLTSTNRELSWQIVSSFLFLRYLCPAILYPHLYDICPGMNEEPVHRSLTEIVKVMQSLANINPGQNAPPAARDFLANTSNAMIDYILMVSSTENLGESPPSMPPVKMERDRMRAMQALNYRISHSPTLVKEAIPVSPQALDVPRQLAIVNSLVVRHARRNHYPIRSNRPADRLFNELCSKCLDVEEQALRRVNQLAKRPPQPAPPQPTSPISPSTPPFSHIPSSPSSTSFQIIPTHRERKASLHGKQKRAKKVPRPSTAPSQTDSDGRSQSQDYKTDISVPPSPITGNNLSRIFSRTSISSRQPSIPIPSKEQDDTSNQGGEPKSLPSGRAPFLHHPRSTSTDSALTRKTAPKSNTPMSPTAPTAYTEPASPDSVDDLGKKGIFRRLVRR